MLHLPDLDECIIYHVNNSIGCTLNSITCNMLAASKSSWGKATRSKWPNGKEGYIPYVERLCQLGSLTKFEMQIAGSPPVAKIGYYPAGTTFTQV